MKTPFKVDRPLVKFGNPNQDAEEWYKHIISKQRSIINIMEDTANSRDQSIEILRKHRDLLETELTRYRDKVIVFNIHNLF